MNRIFKTPTYNKKQSDGKLSAKLMEDLQKLICTVNSPDDETDETTDDNISGRWCQYSPKYEYYGTFAVSKMGTLYEMKLIHKSEEMLLIHPLRILDVTFDGNLWSFYSDWGKKYGVAHFKLKKIHKNRYEGYSHLNGIRGQKSIWLRENSNSNDIATDG